jgi:hypothetical protein
MSFRVRIIGSQPGIGDQARAHTSASDGDGLPARQILGAARAEPV